MFVYHPKCVTHSPRALPAKRSFTPKSLPRLNSYGAATVTYTWLDHGEQKASCPLRQLSEDKLLHALIAENRLQSIHSSEPTLNDIFMEITGRTLV